jgi:hypothetical protein
MDFWRWRMAGNGENPKYCAECRKKFELEDKYPPCDECEFTWPGRRAPELMVENITCLEVHDLCFDARDGMSGGLDYGVLLNVMALMKIDHDEQLEIFGKSRRVEAMLKGLAKNA